ncbi:response regulator [candidate division TA06 bacterium]|nr:response regulator [candidate division TA06 bacterium]
MDIEPLILLVDSDEKSQNTLHSALESEGFRINTASKGKEALKFLRSNEVSFMIIDTSLKDMKGIELIWQIKGLDPDCPLIVTSRDTSGDAEIQAREAGILYYARKPYNVEHILSVIKYSLQ